MVLAPDPVAIGRHGLGNACLLHRHPQKVKTIDFL
jgi:hypothetical protein